VAALGLVLSGLDGHAVAALGAENPEDFDACSLMVDDPMVDPIVNRCLLINKCLL
jgi:hypothetical protein